MPATVRGKKCKSFVRPVMIYGLETVALPQKQEADLEVAELRTIRFSTGQTRIVRIKSEYTRDSTLVRRFGDKMSEGRSRWFGHVKRREQSYIRRSAPVMELPGEKAEED